MDQDPVQMHVDRAALGGFVPDRRRDLERKLSEFGGYALLLLSVAMVFIGLIYLFRSF